MVFSVCLVILAMEEITWGQSFFHFETPEKWKAMNYQGETTLHNLNFMQSNRDNLLLVFGLSGLIGMFLRNHSKFKKIGVPVILLSWFVLIVFLAFLDILVDYIVIYKPLSNGIEKFAEIIELQGDSTQLKNDFRELVKSCFVSMQASTFMTSMVFHQNHMVKGDPAHDAALQNYDTKSE